MIERVKGTQDILDMHMYNVIITKIRSYMKLYNFHEIQTPILEPIDLFVRTLGTYTDVVSKEMFLIRKKEEHEEETICLRPEITAPTMRAFLDHGIQQIPWKVFSIGPNFRYERPQKGRLRQFHQWNIEIIGARDITIDVECIMMFDRFFHEFLHMNNYVLSLNFLGCPEDRKKHHEILYAFIKEHEKNLCAQCNIRKDHNLLRIFDCKEISCQKIYENAPKTTDNLCQICAEEWKFLQNTLSLLSISFMHNPLLVRGLDYYTKTVFEFSSQYGLGAQSAFGGGGRYDQLATVLGSKTAYGAIGAAFGIERLLLVLEPYKEHFQEKEQQLVGIIPYKKEQFLISYLIADQLRAAGVAAEILFEGSIKSRLRRADKNKVSHLIFIGPDEIQKQTVTLKDMKTGVQEIVVQNKIVEKFKQKRGKE